MYFVSLQTEGFYLIYLMAMLLIKKKKKSHLKSLFLAKYN